MTLVSVSIYMLGTPATKVTKPPLTGRQQVPYTGPPMAGRPYRDPYRPDPITGLYPTPTLTSHLPVSPTPSGLPYTPAPVQHRTNMGDGPRKREGGGVVPPPDAGEGGAVYSGRRRKDRAAIADREDREAHGWAYRSRYLTITGPHPVLGPGDHAGARAYLLLIEQAIDRGGWTDNERTRLHRLRRVWSSRAAGQDHRFNLYGNRPGALTADERRQLQHHSSVTSIRGLVR